MREGGHGTAWNRVRARLRGAAGSPRAIVLRSLLKRWPVAGECPICEGRTLFVAGSPWLRDHYYCARCLSVPRFRALMRTVKERFPGWRDLAIHESSPAGAASDRLRGECRQYTATRLIPDAAPGARVNGYRCEDLERQTFADGAFDLAVTQDVFEHVLDPARAFAEIARTLRPGGAHVFTLPWYADRPTVVRARRENGAVVHDLPPDYHGDPFDARGSLVVTEWGAGLLEFIERASGMTTTVETILDPRQGICGEFRDVFVSRKAGGR